jgi:hypothetical protein
LPFGCAPDTPPREVEDWLARRGFSSPVAGASIPGEFWSRVEGVQRRVSRLVARTTPHAAWVDLAGPFHEATRGLTPKDLVEQGDFDEDLMHFLPRGNSMMADLLLERLRPLLGPREGSRAPR